MKMEAMRSFETSVNLDHTMQCYIQLDSTFHMLTYFLCDQNYANQWEAGQVFALYGGENMMQCCCRV
jgi:hypothetical protein